VFLGNDRGGGPVRTTFDVIQNFASLRTRQMKNSEHYSAFARWLCIKGIANYKNDIVVAVAGKIWALIIVLYLRAHIFDIEPPDWMRRMQFSRATLPIFIMAASDVRINVEYIVFFIY
jgi:hypothetical protein